MINIVQSSPDGRTELGILRYDEVDIVQILHHGEHIAALWQQREIADEHEVTDGTIEHGEHSGTTDGLQHSVYQPHRNILFRGVRLCLSKERSSDVHG